MCPLVFLVGGGDTAKGICVSKHLMAIARWAVVGLIVFLLGASVVWTVRSCGGARAGQPRVTRRFHLKITDKAVEKQLLQLFTAKNAAMEEIRVIRRMGEEKNREMAELSKGLQGAFSMDPERNYRYDAKSRTIYELVARPGASVTNAVATEEDLDVLFDRKLHRQLTSDDQVKQFARLAAAKKLAMDQIQSLQMLIREKQLELDKIEKMLGEKFSMVRDRNYQYDTKTMKLYELVVIPQKGEMAPADEPENAATPPEKL